MVTSRHKTTQRRPSRSRAPRSTGHISRELNIVLLLITVVSGAAAWILCSFIYETFINTMPRPLLTGIIFMILHVILLLTVCVYSNIAGTFEENIITGDTGLIGAVLMLILSAVIILGAATLFQWIYGTDFTHKSQEPTSYVFVIDDSGSMNENDPGQLRYKAIETVLAGCGQNFPYMVYSFASDIRTERNMSPISDGIPHISGNNEGGTMIKEALVKVIEDHTNEVWYGGAPPKVILLTDGVATDINPQSPISDVLKKYAHKKISISTIGLGYADSELLNKIAKRTGGVFIDISDASQLSDAMKSAGSQYAGRDLVSVRNNVRLNFLYGFLRVLFITLIGTGIGCAAAVAYGQQDSARIIMGSSPARSFVGALFMELGTGLFRFPDKVMWFILWILIALTVATKITSPGRRAGRLPVRRGKSTQNVTRF